MSNHDPIEENPAELAHAVKLGYEHRDLTTHDFGKPSFTFFIFGILSLAIAWGFLAFSSQILTKTSMKDRQEPAVRRALPPEPLIQSGNKAKQDIKDLRIAEESHMNGYGWVDESKGIVHIPIDQAMEMTAKQGLSPTAASSPAPTEATP